MPGPPGRPWFETSRPPRPYPAYGTYPPRRTPVKRPHNDDMTVGMLIEYLQELDADLPVYVERIDKPTTAPERGPFTVASISQNGHTATVGVVE